MLVELTASPSSTNIAPPRRTNLSKTNCPTDLVDSEWLNRNSGKRTVRSNSLSQQEIILKILKQPIRFREPSMIGHRQSAKSETNCPTDVFDSSGFSRNSGKRTARSNFLTRHGIILKILRRLIRFRELSMIGRQPSAKAETNCPTHVFESELLTSILVKRTAWPNSLSQEGIILKILKRFIRCHQQIPDKFGPGIEVGGKIFWAKAGMYFKIRRQRVESSIIGSHQ
jgi:hypothetical protein